MPMSGYSPALVLARLICTAAAILALCIPALADSDDDGEFAMSVPGVRTLKLDRNSLQFTPGAMELENGWTQQQVIIARVSANVDWVVKLSGTENYWDGPWEKPVADIHWKYGGGGFTSLTTTEAAVEQGGPANQRSLPIHFKIKLDWVKDIPGEYTYAYILFEVTEP